MDFSISDLNFNSVETLPGYEARAAFTVNSATVFREDVDIVPTIIDDKLSCVPWGGDNQMPFDLLALFLNLAEDWVRTTFTSESTFNTICGYTDSNNIKILCSRPVVADALRRAIPSLDIVLTPNGFGVVNTSNLSPASKPRLDRLVGYMLAHRDDCIAALLPELPGASKWLASAQADFFGATLYGKSMTFKPYERISIFYWFAALKDTFSRKYSDFFQPIL